MMKHGHIGFFYLKFQHFYFDNLRIDRFPLSNNIPTCTLKLFVLKHFLVQTVWTLPETGLKRVCYKKGYCLDNSWKCNHLSKQV